MTVTPGRSDRAAHGKKCGNTTCARSDEAKQTTGAKAKALTLELESSSSTLSAVCNLPASEPGVHRAYQCRNSPVMSCISQIGLVPGIEQTRRAAGDAGGRMPGWPV